jgi:hypothetical protein
VGSFRRSTAPTALLLVLASCGNPTQPEKARVDLRLDLSSTWARQGQVVTGTATAVNRGDRPLFHWESPGCRDTTGISVWVLGPDGAPLESRGLLCFGEPEFAPMGSFQSRDLRFDGILDPESSRFVPSGDYTVVARFTWWEAEFVMRYVEKRVKFHWSRDGISN